VVTKLGVTSALGGKYLSYIVAIFVAAVVVCHHEGESSSQAATVGYQWCYFCLHLTVTHQIPKPALVLSHLCFVRYKIGSLRAL